MIQTHMSTSSTMELHPSMFAVLISGKCNLPPCSTCDLLNQFSPNLGKQFLQPVSTLVLPRRIQFHADKSCLQHGEDNHFYNPELETEIKKLRHGFRGLLHTLDPGIEMEKLRLDPWFFYTWFCCSGNTQPK